MKDKYELTRDKRGFSIAFINATIFWFAAKVLSSKMLRKMQPNQCTTKIIVGVEQCVGGGQLNWSTYLMNELLVDAEELHEKVSPFHYSWLLILIFFFLWEEPPKYQGVYVPVQCRGDQYQNIWFEKEKTKQQKDNNVEFFLQGEALRYYIRK